MKNNMIDEYLEGKSWKIAENANVDFSLQGLMHHVSKEDIKDYWMYEIYDRQIRKAHNDGLVHQHDLGSLSTYCVGWDLYDLLLTGFKGVRGKIQSEPAKHLNTALMQIVNFIFSLQNESAGAQALNNFDTLLAPFVRYDDLTYKELEQQLQMFLYNMNVDTRSGAQTPFSNITMDLVCPDNFKNTPVIIGGEQQKETYGDFQREMDMINKLFAKLLIDGDSKGRPFTFPIPNLNLTKDFNWDSTRYDPIWEMTAKRGSAYFSNFINSDMDPEDSRSMCPMRGNTDVIVRSKQNGVRICNINEIVNNMETNGTEYETLTPEGWCKAKPVVVKKTDIYRINLSNGSVVEFGENHLQPTNYGTLKTSELEIGMKLPFNKYIVYDTDEDFNYYYIEKIEKITTNDSVLYCFEVDNNNHLFTLANGLVTHNCRLRLSKKELRRRGGGLFGADALTGSIGVCTINMNQIAYLSKDQPDFFVRLRKAMDIAKKALVLKREAIEYYADLGLYPRSTFYLRNIKKRFGKYWANHFSTIGLIGLNDAIYTLFGCNIGDEKGIEFAKEVLNFMREVILEYQDETGDLFNVEASPAEGTAFRLAKIDRRKFPDIKIYNSEINPSAIEEYYTNSSQLPVDYSDSIQKVLDKQDDIQCLYTGGTVLHLYVGESHPSINGLKKLIKRIAEIYKLPYFTFSPNQSICPNHGLVGGTHYKCPTCGEQCEVYNRVVGFYRPVNQFNAGKQQEFKDRKMFDTGSI
jgi:ribonucleoside-triphosphate reductase